MNTKTLLVLLLCGVCFACNAPQQFGSPKIQEELTETHYIR